MIVLQVRQFQQAVRFVLLVHRDAVNFDTISSLPDFIKLFLGDLLFLNAFDQFLRLDPRNETLTKELGVRLRFTLGKLITNKVSDGDRIKLGLTIGFHQVEDLGVFLLPLKSDLLLHGGLPC